LKVQAVGGRRSAVGGSRIIEFLEARRTRFTV